MTAWSAATISLTVPTSALGRHIGYLLSPQEAELTDAIRAAFDLD